VDLVVAKARLVDDVGAEGVALVHRQDLAVALARVAEAGDGVALERGLSAQIFLERVVRVQPIAAAERMRKVARPLVDVHRRHLGSDKARRTVDRRIGVRDELQQLRRQVRIAECGRRPVLSAEAPRMKCF
jgi:hypothetical protein